ncbi:hypothetical protein HPB49_012796 [Dermacentor silvarum]|uniref:Uncharacterized protein n=1 Tax=Dermacentor silvarum TaxID=543639 RepID=A0ACB8DD12_DERSI|nr:hypothetical protein HPB49_012796 [Dermacentor silvarum]
MESSGECGKKTGDPGQPESIRREKSDAFSRHRGDNHGRVADKQKVPKLPAPSQARGLEHSSKMPTKDAPATKLLPMNKSKEALELEIEKKKKVMGTIKLNTLPDGGKRLRDQLKELEDQLSLLCLSAPNKQGTGTESSSAKDMNTTAKHSFTSSSRGESTSDAAVEKSVREADTGVERALPACKESKKSAPTKSDVRERDPSKVSHQSLQTKSSSDARGSNASAGDHKKHSDRLSHDIVKSRAMPESAEKQRSLESKESRVQSSLREHILADTDLSERKCESMCQSTTAADIPLKGTSSLTSVQQGPSGGGMVKRRPVSPVARAGICGEEPRPPTSALHSVYDRRTLLVSPLPLSKTAAPLAKKGATLEALGTRVPRGLSERCTARLQHLFQSLSSQPDEWDESPQPEGVRTPLMPHQRQALRWMLWREEQEAPGGILADAMGLGKTLTMLTLIEQQRSSDKSHKSASGIENSNKHDDNDDCETAAAASPRGGTLVVCPLSLLHQWEEEVQRHLPDRWQVQLHHGRNRTSDPQELARCDLVVTTYDTISSDWARVDAAGNSGLSPLLTVRWRRLVLDEAHSIRNLHTRRAKAACALLAWSRWALTGTPVHNDLNDMRSLLKSRPFLQPDAIPTIFPNFPKYLSKPVLKKRNLKERLDPQFAPPQKKSRIDVASPDTSDEAPTLAANSVDYQNVIMPSNQWGKHIFSESPLFVAYSVCLPGPNMSLLHAQKLVLFRGGDSMIERQVFVRGVELSLDEHCDPASLLQAVDSMQLCSGAAQSVEFPLARSSNITWNESLYHMKCNGVVSGPEKCCIACKYLRRLLLNQRCRARQLKRKENYARKLKARTQATVRRLRAKAKCLDEALTQQKQANHAIEESTLKKKIDRLPPKQKAAIMQCLEAA